MRLQGFARSALELSRQRRPLPWSTASLDPRPDLYDHSSRLCFLRLLTRKLKQTCLCRVVLVSRMVFKVSGSGLTCCLQGSITSLIKRQHTQHAVPVFSPPLNPCHIRAVTCKLGILNCNSPHTSPCVVLQLYWDCDQATTHTRCSFCVPTGA
jgi:hypothetical protein